MFILYLCKMKNPKIDKLGRKCWYNSKGELHNESGPAIIYKNGSMRWYINGKLHNSNGPAIIQADGTKTWYKNGKRHNDNEPSINIYGDKEWYFKGGLHSINGCPAIIRSDRTKFWYKRGLRHNDFGPAVIWSYGKKEWFIDDKRLTEEEFKQYKIKQFIGGDNDEE